MIISNCTEEEAAVAAAGSQGGAGIRALLK